MNSNIQANSCLTIAPCMNQKLADSMHKDNQKQVDYFKIAEGTTFDLKTTHTNRYVLDSLCWYIY